MVTICAHCGNVDDPARDLRCPCQTPPASLWQVERRHREAVERARVRAAVERANSRRAA